ncbi:hypothetical protein LOD99_11816 [Oopsacas minuta]|uniref:Uncharacterized protein n=1 Tax=Oopsacas minuta TaxID=111878 RepID=A0AAV7JLY0_9METZ|nr:hypothetical protein LOD99_11816 [Oopsacas minuta]
MNQSQGMLFFLFFSFELSYCSTINIFGFLNLFYNSDDILISIGSNCTLQTGTFLGNAYDTRFGMIALNALSIFREFSFCMMIWFFGASLLHLSFAARNQLKMRTVLHFILLGIVINIAFTIIRLIPSTSIFGKIAQSLMDQISLFIVLYIANKKFFPVMNSRVIDAYHLHNPKLQHQQK